MTDLRKMAVFRDVQVAMDFQKMAENGYIDEEFTMYGCTYLKDNTRLYLISSEEIKIVEFLQNSIKENLFPSPMEHLTEVCHVPLGEREEIANTVKIKLAQKLQAAYPLEFLLEFQSWTHREPTNVAYEMIQQYVKTVVNSFSREKIELAEKLVLLAYECKTISRESYERFMMVLQKETYKLCDDVIVKDLLKKTFHTIMYAGDGDKIQYVTNARLETIEKRRERFILDGKIVSPIFTKTYWYNNQQRLEDIQDRHRTNYLNALTEEYFYIVKEIYTVSSCQSTLSRELLQEVKEKYGEKSAAMIAHYGYKWHILK